jgi:serine/threonine-protein kinase
MDEARTHLIERARQRVGTALRKGKYSLGALLGVGAMGAVYLAVHRNGMRVAIKILHPEVARIEGLRSRFLREGYIANIVHHSGLVRVLDDDIEDDGTTFLVMELLEGRTLDAEWDAARGLLPLQRVAEVVRHLLDVLAAIHAAGIVHRDIKPENVFLEARGGLKLLDLGIARLLVESRMTASGEILGTPEYVAPEQAMGQVRTISARTDVYSVGAMMFSLLTGQPVHPARTPMEAIIFGATRPARSLTTAWPNVPPALAHVVDVALAFEPERRWSSAMEMRDALDAALRTIRLSAPPTAPAAAIPHTTSGTLLGSPAVRTDGTLVTVRPPSDKRGG